MAELVEDNSVWDFGQKRQFSTYESYWRRHTPDELRDKIKEKPLNKSSIYNLLKYISITFYPFTDFIYSISGLCGLTSFCLDKNNLPRWSIRININVEEEKQKLTLAHELGHIVYGVCGNYPNSWYEKCEDLIETEAKKLCEERLDIIDYIFKRYNLNKYKLKNNQLILI